jgi:hypothetical protein
MQGGLVRLTMLCLVSTVFISAGCISDLYKR